MMPGPHAVFVEGSGKGAFRIRAEHKGGDLIQPLVEYTCTSSLLERESFSLDFLLEERTRIGSMLTLNLLTQATQHDEVSRRR